MSHEFVHTSVQKGVRGDSGFALAVVTRGLSPALAPVLAELSAYEFNPAHVAGADRVEWAHRIVVTQGRSHTVLSRIAPCGNDWSGRPNRIAHHLVLDVAERADAGPAWVLQNFDDFAESVPGVEERSAGPRIPGGADPARRASAWESAGLDPGWAGVVAAALVDAPSQNCCVVLPGEMETMGLVADVLTLVPPERRWLVTFSTRFGRVPAAARCQLRLLRADAPGLQRILMEPGVRVIRVDRGADAGRGVAAECGRLGREVGVRSAATSHEDPPAAQGHQEVPATERTSVAPPASGFARAPASGAKREDERPTSLSGTDLRSTDHGSEQDTSSASDDGGRSSLIDALLAHQTPVALGLLALSSLLLVGALLLVFAGP